MGLGWSVTTQDPCSTPPGRTQNLGYPPRIAVSPPTAWLQSDCSQSAKRLQTPKPRPMVPPPKLPLLLPLLPQLPLFLLPRPVGKQSTRFGHCLGVKGSLPYQAPFPGLGLDAPSFQSPLGLSSLRHVPCLAWELINTKERPLSYVQNIDPHP